MRSRTDRGQTGLGEARFSFLVVADSLTSRPRSMTGREISSERRARDASTQEKEVEDEGSQPHGGRLEVGCPVGQRVPALQQLEVATHRVR